jgi:hypothetical protein
MRFVQSGIDEGATLLTGGARPPAFEKGYVYVMYLLTTMRVCFWQL